MFKCFLKRLKRFPKTLKSFFYALKSRCKRLFVLFCLYFLHKALFFNK